MALNPLKKPLSVDKQTVKELGIPPEADVSPIKKLTFLQGQLEEMEAQVWRERVNVIHAERLILSDDEAIRRKGNNNIMEHKTLVKQFTGGILMIRELINELREEYPELRIED